MANATTKKKKKRRISKADISSEMKDKYIDYSMSVIVSRALPDVRDGLKPVQRRILYSMYKLGILPGSAFKKSARTVGDVMAKFHPHGDAAIYDALVRMAQDFNMRYTLVEGQGNFGSIDGDSQAAMRYTEARLEKIAVEMLKGLGSNTVDYAPNYDGAELEPTVLPTLVPNLLMNGVDGIAVGMATKIPTHNLGEVVDATLSMVEKWREESSKEKLELPADFAKDLKKYDPLKAQDEIDALPKKAREILKIHGAFAAEVEVEDLMKHIKGPDFPTGAVIYDKKAIKEMYATGRGKIVMRAVAEIEESSGDKFRIVVTEIPYQVNKARMVEKIAKLVKDKKIKGIRDLRDESSREGLRVVIELKKGVSPKTVLARLYKYSEMQLSFHGNFVALVNGEPRLLSLREMLEEFMKHRQEVVIRKTLFDLSEAKARAHILEGLKIALDHLDEVIKTIRESKDADTAKAALIMKFKLSEVQAQAILDMQLRRLAALERKKIEEEYKDTLKLIDDYVGVLSSPEKVLSLVEESLKEIKEKYGDARRTKVVAGKPDKATEEELIPDEDVVIMVSKAGYVKRLPANTYKTQHRGGKGVTGATTRKGDYLSHIFICSTRDRVLFFTNLGKMFELQAHEIPEFSRQAKGQPLVNLISLGDGEKVTSVLTKRKGGFVDEDMSQEGQNGESEATQSKAIKAVSKYLVMGTKQGVVKRTEAKEFENIRANGLKAIGLKDDDQLKWVRVTDGNKDLVVASSSGHMIRFKESEVSVLGRTARGVRGIKVVGEDEMIGLDVVRKAEDRLLVVSEKGYGKITFLKNYATKHRGGKGMLTFKVAEKTGKLLVIRVLDHPEKNILIMSKKGQVIKTTIDTIRVTGRVASGVKLIELDKGDTVTSVACW